MKQMWQVTTVLLLSILALALVPQPDFASGGASAMLLRNGRMMQIRKMSPYSKSHSKRNAKPQFVKPGPSNTITSKYLPIRDVVITTSSDGAAPMVNKTKHSTADIPFAAGIPYPHLHPQINPSMDKASIIITFGGRLDPGYDQKILLRFSVVGDGQPSDVIVGINGQKYDPSANGYHWQVNSSPNGSSQASCDLVLKSPQYASSVSLVVTASRDGYSASAAKSDYASVTE